MKEIFKRINSVLLAASLCTGLICTPVSAEETGEYDGGVHIYEVLTDDISDLAREGSVPNEFHNLGGNNNYTASFHDVAADRGVYTNYYFATSTGDLYANVRLERSGTTTNTLRMLKIELYERDLLSTKDKLLETAVATFTENNYSGRYQFTGYDPHKFYYFLFTNISNSKPSSAMDISGTIVIDDT